MVMWAPFDLRTALHGAYLVPGIGADIKGTQQNSHSTDTIPLARSDYTLHDYTLREKADFLD